MINTKIATSVTLCWVSPFMITYPPGYYRGKCYTSGNGILAVAMGWRVPALIYE
jgi:hypothetical protein